MWKKCCFSGDGEYVCAGSARQHDLYIWERSVGTLVKILQGTKGELLLDVVWHPVRPIVTSISAGVVSVWAQNQVSRGRGWVVEGGVERGVVGGEVWVCRGTCGI